MTINATARPGIGHADATRASAASHDQSASRDAAGTAAVRSNCPTVASRTIATVAKPLHGGKWVDPDGFPRAQVRWRRIPHRWPKPMPQRPAPSQPAAKAKSATRAAPRCPAPARKPRRPTPEECAPPERDQRHVQRHRRRQCRENAMQVIGRNDDERRLKHARPQPWSHCSATRILKQRVGQGRTMMRGSPQAPAASRIRRPGWRALSADGRGTDDNPGDGGGHGTPHQLHQPDADRHPPGTHRGDPGRHADHGAHVPWTGVPGVVRQVSCDDSRLGQAGPQFPSLDCLHVRSSVATWPSQKAPAAAPGDQHEPDEQEASRVMQAGQGPSQPQRNHDDEARAHRRPE